MTTYDLILENNKSSSKSNIPKKASERTKSTAGTVKQKTTQELFDDIIDQLDVLLAEIIADENDFSRFNIVKTKLRELFIQLEKQRVEFIFFSDQYLRQQATMMVRFLKILAEHMNEPLIVDLG